MYISLIRKKKISSVISVIRFWNDLFCETVASHSASLSPESSSDEWKQLLWGTVGLGFTMFHSNVSLVKTSFACICNAWLNIYSASKAERKYHSVNCLGIQMCCFLFATHCPKQISPECILFVLQQDGDYETFWQNYKFKCHTLH